MESGSRLAVSFDQRSYYCRVSFHSPFFVLSHEKPVAGEDRTSMGFELLPVRLAVVKLEIFA